MIRYSPMFGAHHTIANLREKACSFEHDEEQHLKFTSYVSWRNIVKNMAYID